MSTGEYSHGIFMVEYTIIKEVLLGDCVMTSYFRKLITSVKSSAFVTVIAVLLAGTLAKLGHEWWGIATILALCLLDARPSRRVGHPERPSDPALG
jgi:hypothetical protein